MLHNYRFNYIKTENLFHRIWNSIIVWCICKWREVMFANKISCSLPHGWWVKFVRTMVGITGLKWIHDRVIVYLVVVYLARCWETGMKLRTCWANLPDSYIRGKKAIDTTMKVFQVFINERCHKMCDLKWTKPLLKFKNKMILLGLV